MQDSKNTDQKISSDSFSQQRKIVFNLILLLLPVLLIFLLEMGLRTLHYGKNLKLFVKSENYEGYYEINREVNYRYFSKVGETSPTGDVFLINKPDTCYRIFVFGGSTTRGFPYQESTAFPRILYYRLQDAFPHKRIEVVNLSASAINSYSYIDMVDEVLSKQPDLILVYGGHNEYYGALGVGSVEKGGNFRWMKKLNLKLTRFRTYQLLKAVIGKIAQKVSSSGDSLGETLMSRIVKDKSIVYGSELYQRGVDQFDQNMNELIRKITRKHVPVVISEVVSNVHDLPPLGSIKTDTEPAAIDVYHRAKELEDEGKVAEAIQQYYKAKDLDVIRFRAPEAMNEVIHHIGDKYNIPVVSMKRYFEDASPEGIIGDELILEHLHPNVNGYFLMADAFFKTLKADHLIDKDWNLPTIPAAYYRDNWGFTALDSLIGDLNIRSLKSGWPFIPENEPNTFIKTYKPHGFVDSMAFHYLISPVRHIEDEHIKLAHHYAALGQKDKAFKEYYSLIKLHPYIGDLYYDASNYLIEQGKFKQALKLILSAPNIAHDYFYSYMIGTLKLKTGQVAEGIKTLEHALSVRTKDDHAMKVLLPLYMAYREQGDSINKQRLLEKIKTLNPDFKEPVFVPTKPGQKVVRVSFTEIYDRALKLIQANERERALDLLLKTDRIADNASIKKLIGMVYFMDKNYPLAYKYSRESYQINPNDYDNLNNYFILNLMKKDLKTAAEILQQLPSLKIEPDQIERFQRLYEKRRRELGPEVEQKN